MTVTPYTLNNLYQKGILDYVPAELAIPMPVGNMSMQNPYLNTAQQGSLYQQYGNGSDSFTPTSAINGNTQQGYQFNNTGAAGFYGNGSTGAYNNNNLGTRFGFDGTGNQSANGIGTMYGEPGIGEKSNINFETIHGGFGNAKNSISNGFNQASAAYSSTPKAVKGLIAAGLILLTVFGMFKFGGKKAGAGTTKNFWSKLNPVNWFKKS